MIDTGTPEDRVFTATSALRFVVAFGVVSLFADMTYEGMRSIAGPYLALLGASSTAVGLIAGLAELLGYALRLASGSFVDRARRYWPVTLAGYALQMIVVPALALTASWPAAAALMILERAGKGMRNPPRNAMLSHAGERVGQGWAFGLHEALDQSGATIGPLLVAWILARHLGYHAAFAWLLLPAGLTLLLVGSVRVRFGAAGQVAPAQPIPSLGNSHLPRSFWLYTLGASLAAFGFADYALVAYHFARSGAVHTAAVPIFYAAAMLAGGGSSLLIGRAYDRLGLMVLVPATLIVAPYASMVFLGGFGLSLAGTLLWGIGVGVHDALMSAVVAQMVPLERRARAFGLFMALFGVAWFAGSAALGTLYGRSVRATAMLATVAELLAVIPIILAARALRAEVASRRVL